jgi:DNA end-binding protein Ku
MARAIWSGSISFGLVNIPIKLYNAVSRKSVRFNQIDNRTGARIRYRKVSALDGEDVPDEVIVKGYELGPDSYVLVEQDELDALDPDASRTVDIEEFVDLAEIDPVFYDAAYHVAPVKSAEKPYALLVRAMEEQGKVAIARFVMRNKQYLAALRPQDGHLVLSTMVYADELIPSDAVPELETLTGVEVTDRELGMARQLVESLSEAFAPERFRDEYRDRVLDLIERKAAGETVVSAPPAAQETKVVDLMAALEASVKEARKARERHPVTGDADAAARRRDDDTDAEAAEVVEPEAEAAGAG